MNHLSNYPPGSNTPDAPWNQPDADPNDCEICGDSQGEFEHPDLGWICWECWPKCWICGDTAAVGSEGPCCEKCEKEGNAADA